MLRQRLKTRANGFALVGQVLVFGLACALVFYGAILALLALKVSPSSLDDISAYRVVYDRLAGLRESDVSDTRRIVGAGGGLLTFLVFGSLALKQLPRPYLARHQIELINDERGVVTVEPRAIERVAESAATRHPAITAAAGRYGDDQLAVGVSLGQARGAAETLTDVQASIAAALAQHGLPVVPINLTLTGYERTTHRELD